MGIYRWQWDSTHQEEGCCCSSTNFSSASPTAGLFVKIESISPLFPSLLPSRRVANSRHRPMLLETALNSCSSISRGNPWGLRRSFNHSISSNIKLIRMPRARQSSCQLPQANAAAQHINSGETLIPHPQPFSTAHFHWQGLLKKKKGKEKQNRRSHSTRWFTLPGRHTPKYIQGTTAERAETNFAVIRDVLDNWPKGKSSSTVLQYGLALESRQNMPTAVLVTLLAFYI